MKKLLACLSAVVLLASVLLVGVFPAAAGDEPAQSPNILADYTTQAAYDAAVNGGKLSTSSTERTALSFDADLGAAKVTYLNPSNSTRTDEAWVYMDPMSEVAVAGNEVIVAKVKVPAGKNAQGYLTYSNKAMAGDKAIAYKNLVDNNGNHWYNKADAPDVLAGEDGWLYVAYTAKADVDAAGVAADAKWGRLQVIGHGSFYNTNDTLSIAWVGAFASLEAAKTWDEGATAPSTEPSTAPSEPAGLPKADGASDYFYDFTQGVNTTKSDTGKYMGCEGNTEMSYNADVKAMEIATKAGDTSDVNMAKFQFFNGDGIPAATEPVVSDYPYFAMKLKLATTDITPGTSILTRNDEKNGWVSLPVKYEMNTDWQLVVVDASAVTDPTVWWVTIFNLIANKPANAALYDGTAETIGYVQWAGAFDSKESAEAYFDATTEATPSTPSIPSTPSTTPSSESTGESTTTSTKPTLAVNKGEKFYFDLSTEEGYQSASGWTQFRALLDNAKGTDTFGVGSNKYNAGSNLSYDADAQAAKVIKADGNVDKLINFVVKKQAAGLDAEYPDEYPVVGIKVKMNEKAKGGLFGYARGIGGSFTLPWSVGKYTGEWQLLTFAAPEYASTVDDKSWKGVIGQLVTNPQDFANDEVIGHVAWAGVFASEDDAMNHFLNTTPDYVAPEPPVDDGTPFLVDLTTKEKYDSAVDNGLIFTNNPDNASLEYNENVGAAMFTYLNGKPISDARRGEAGFCFRAGKDLKVADGKVIVAKLRFSSDNYLTYSHSAMIKNGAIIGYTNGTNGNFEYAASNPSMLKGDGEWVYCAYTDPDMVDTATPKPTANSVWQGLDITAHGSFYQEGDTVTVAWVGAFESLEAAQEYDQASTGGTTKPTTKPTQPPAGSEDPVDRPFFVDLSTEAKYKKANGSTFKANGDGNVKLEYDATVGGVKVMTATDTPSNIGSVLFMNRDTGTTYEDYPYFVMKVKLAEGKGKLMAPSSGLFATARYSGFRGGLKSMVSYQDTDDWQLLIYQAKESYHPEMKPENDWNAVISAMFNDGEAITAGETLGWIQWGGIFASMEEAYTFAGIDPEKAPTDLFWRFDSEDAVKKPVRNAGDTAIAYDEEFDAMKITATDTDGDKFVAFTPGRIVLGAKQQIKGDYDVNEYPYVAVRVRIANKLQDGGGLYVRSTGSLESARQGTIDSADMLAGTVNYENISNWQTVIMRWDEDPMVKFFFSGNWKQIQFNAFSEAIGAAAEGDAAWVRWIGAFKSLEDIEAYVNSTMAYEIGDTSDGAIPEPDPTQATTTTTTTTEATTTTTEETTEATTEATTTTTEEVVEEEEIFYEPQNWPYKGDNGHWIIDDEEGPIDTGIPYSEDALLELGENGNWYIDGVDTGIKAILVEVTPDDEVPSEDEETPDMGENSFFSIVIVILAVAMGAMMVLFSKKNKAEAQ